MKIAIRNVETGKLAYAEFTKNSSVRPILSGGNLWHPDIWVKK